MTEQIQPSSNLTPDPDEQIQPSSLLKNLARAKGW